MLEGGRRGQRFPLENYLRSKSLQKFDADIATMQSLAEEMVAHRRAHPTEKKDLLNALILGRDPVTGKGMTDQSIMDNSKCPKKQYIRNTNLCSDHSIDCR